MTDIVTPPTIAPLPAPPQPSDTPAEFDSKAFASLAAQVAMTSQMNASASATRQNAVAAEERATAANASAGTATTQANAAMGYRNEASSHASAAAASASAAGSSASAAQASAVAASKLNLGNKSSPPATDNQGQPLLVGATYYDTTLNKWRVWNGSAWADGISAVAGVSSVNGKTGAATLTAADVGALAVGQYGFGAPALPTGVSDMNAAEVRTMWFMGNAMSNAPSSGWFLVQQIVHNAQWVTQVAYGMSGLDGQVFLRQKSSGTWGGWKAMAFQSEAPVAVSGGAIDLSKGSTFYAEVGGNTTFLITNFKPGHSFVLEVYLTAGVMTFISVIWPDGIAPTGLQVNKRHLFFFQLPNNQNFWLASYLGSYAP